MYQPNENMGLGFSFKTIMAKGKGLVAKAKGAPGILERLRGPQQAAQPSQVIVNVPGQGAVPAAGGGFGGMMKFAIPIAIAGAAALFLFKRKRA